MIKKYDLVAPTSMGIRITPDTRQGVHCSNYYFMQATSAESNVLTISSALGLKTKVLTKFVKDSPIAEFIKRDLRARNIEFDNVNVAQGGPWGYRHQFNIADGGFGVRAPRVLNDRAGEVGLTLNKNDFDIEDLFKNQGVKILHLSGLVCALSDNTAEFCLECANVAKKNGTIISFDLNYRESFWKDRKEKLSSVFSSIASISDVLIGNEEDFQLCLNVKGPEAGGKDIERKIEIFKDMITLVKEKYPNVKVFANTLREVISANEHLWGSILFDGKNWYEEAPRRITVLDRIGGGDGFVGGLLYGILKNWEYSKCNAFAWASGALATTFITDYALPADEKQVWSIYEGNARVQR